jgi:hypothetical protein
VTKRQSGVSKDRDSSQISFEEGPELFDRRRRKIRKNPVDAHFHVKCRLFLQIEV